MRRILLIAMAVFLALTCSAYAAKKFPSRNITNVVVWGAGGGTDTCNRIISAEMAPFLGVNVNVINKTGGVGGSVGMTYGFSQPHDGYTLTGLSESNVTAGVQGGWDKNFDVWDPFIVGGSPDLISVTANAPYKTLKDLVEAAKKDPENAAKYAPPTRQEILTEYGHRLIRHLFRVFRVQLLRPVDTLSGIPLLGLALFIQIEQCFPPVLVFPLETGRVVLVKIPLQLRGRDGVVQVGGHVHPPERIAARFARRSQGINESAFPLPRLALPAVHV